MAPTDISVSDVFILTFPKKLEKQFKHQRLENRNKTKIICPTYIFKYELCKIRNISNVKNVQIKNILIET